MPVALAAFNLGLASLFVRRAPEASAAPWSALAAALPAIAVSGTIAALAPAPEAWPAAATLAFLIGVAWTLASLLTLGRSFAVLPGVRALVTEGPYRLVRNPAYLGELVMLGACTGAHARLAAQWPLLVALPLLVLRIRAEERVLREGLPGYADYCEAVRYRLLPFVW